MVEAQNKLVIMLDVQVSDGQNAMIEDSINLHAHADIIKKARDEVTFAPKDVELVRKWEEERKLIKNGLNEFLDNWKSMKKLTETKHFNDDEEVKSANKKNKSKEDRKRKPTGASKKDDETPAIKKKKKNKEKQLEFDGEDIVEDFVLSDDDEL